MAGAENLNHSLTSLSQDISTKVEELIQLLKSGSHPFPSLKADGPSEYPSNGEIYNARYAIVDAATTLINLALGPREFLSTQALCLKADAAALGALYHWDIFNIVPPSGSISYSDIAHKKGLSMDKTERIIKYAMTSKIFYEPEPGMVAHTANSIAPAKNAQLNAWLGIGRGESDPAMLRLEEAIEKWGDSGKLNETAYNLACRKNEEDTYWTVMANDGEGKRKGWRMKRFGMAMGVTRRPGPDRQSPMNVMFDWDGLGEATIVDVGGGGGHISVDVATFHPKLRFIVQDQPSQEEIFKSQVPRNLRSRISFQAHDFFTPQPVKGADVYFLSAVLHDWSDEMALKILQQLVPTMKPSTRILVFEGIMAEFGEVTNAQMRITRSVDLMMLSLLNGKERTKENWMQLVENADPKLTVKNIVSPSFGGPRPLIEIGFGDK